jgi:50S ribosomal protein L16 3-hydroxylase
MYLSNFDIPSFLRDYWQKRPCVIRSPWEAWTNPLAPDELAGLACDDGVEARLVRTTRKTWKVEHGPFAEARFTKREKKPWTLLVQAVDHIVPDVAALIAPFRFVPNWRIDDVMVSYASDGGGVGPHFDQYDVFLIQGLGKRRWQVGGMCDNITPLLPHDDLRLLADFAPTDEWVLEPGDILYVPPRVAHNGVAVSDDCMTYSVGFRAPSRAELVAHWADHLLSGLADDDRYADPDLAAQATPGEISDDALDRLHTMVTETLADRAAFARWFGGYTSTPKYPDTDWAPEPPVDTGAVQAALIARATLIRNAASRFAFVRQGKNLTLFVDGATFECAGKVARFAEDLCAHTSVRPAAALARSAAGVALITALINQGSVMFEF